MSAIRRISESRERKDPAKGRARIPGYLPEGFHISTSSAQPQPSSPFEGATELQFDIRAFFFVFFFVLLFPASQVARVLMLSAAGSERQSPSMCVLC